MSIFLSTRNLEKLYALVSYRYYRQVMGHFADISANSKSLVQVVNTTHTSSNNFSVSLLFFSLLL